MKKQFDLSAAALHILAMAFMLLDHLWATLFLSQEWMTCVGRLAFPIFAFIAVTVLGFALGTLGMVDYYGMGVLTVFVFYFLRGREWWKLLGQIAALYWINVSLIGGQIFPIELFGLEFEVCEQGLALLSLVPIWLYRGRQGHHSKVFQYACYAFYPVHMLILGLIQLSL